MFNPMFARAGLIAVLAIGLSGCGGGGLNLFGGQRAAPNPAAQAERARARQAASESADFNRIPLDEGPVVGETRGRQTIWDLFRGDGTSELNTNVNRYLWQASLDVLSFLPVETVDPFSGVIVTGFGAPPGGGRAYRATVYISDPSLDARSLRLAMQQRGGGAVSPEVVRQIEDAILTRARELRVRDSRL